MRAPDRIRSPRRAGRRRRTGARPSASTSTVTSSSPRASSTLRTASWRSSIRSYDRSSRLPIPPRTRVATASHTRSGEGTVREIRSVMSACTLHLRLHSRPWQGQATSRCRSRASRDGGATVVRVEGELDMSTCPELEHALEGADLADHVVVDLSGCTFFDSSALRVLVPPGASGSERRRKPRARRHRPGDPARARDPRRRHDAPGPRHARAASRA